MSLSVSTMRVGKKYKLVNHRESFFFEVMGFVHPANPQLKDLNTLERYTLQDLLQYGKGSDYLLTEA